MLIVSSNSRPNKSFEIYERTIEASGIVGFQLNASVVQMSVDIWKKTLKLVSELTHFDVDAAENIVCVVADPFVKIVVGG
jgi:hypothetical protein